LAATPSAARIAVDPNGAAFVLRSGSLPTLVRPLDEGLSPPLTRKRSMHLCLEESYAWGAEERDPRSVLLCDPLAELSFREYALPRHM